MDVLLLGGTGRARALAGELLASGVDVVTSLAGRTRTPRSQPGPVHTGGFGGAPGLAEFLTSHRVRLLVDATHAFATTMHAHVHEAAALTATPLLRLGPPSWRAHPAASEWTWVDDHDAAADAVSRLAPSDAGPRSAHTVPDSRLTPSGSDPASCGTVLLTVGRQPVPHYLPLGPRPVIVRCVDPPARALPAGWQVLCERGPFTLAGERELFATALGLPPVAVVVSKDSGGTDLDPKLVVAAETGARVVMVGRGPEPPWRDQVGEVDRAAAWVRAHLG